MSIVVLFADNVAETLMGHIASFAQMTAYQLMAPPLYSFPVMQYTSIYVKIIRIVDRGEPTFPRFNPVDNTEWARLERPLQGLASKFDQKLQISTTTILRSDCWLCMLALEESQSTTVHYGKMDDLGVEV